MAGDGAPLGGTRALPEPEQSAFLRDDEPPRREPPPPPPDRARRDRRPGRGGRYFRRFLAVVLVLVVALIGLGWYAWSKIEKVDAIPEDHGDAKSDGRVYLVVGSDSREGLSQDERNELGTGTASGQRTDTIMLLHVPTSGRPALISIPRDSLVEIPEHGTERINAAFAYGGAPLLVDTIEANTGVAIDDYVEIGFGGFASIVDALGGVEMCLDEAMKDDKAHINLPKGCQTLNGTDALGFARSRNFADADLTRVENQRELIGAIGKKAMSPGTLINPLKLTESALAGGDALVLDEDTGPLDMWSFIRGIMSVTGDGGDTLTVPIADASNTVSWDTERAGQLWESLRNGQEAPRDLLEE